MSFEERLSTTIKARFPVLYIVSPEESRVRKMLNTIAFDHKKDLYLWSITNGWTSTTDLPANLPLPVPAEEDKGLQLKGMSAEMSAAVKAMQEIGKMAATQSEKGRIYVLTDFDAFLENSFVERSIRDCARKFPYQGHDTLIIISPTMKIPDRLSKDFTVLEMELPSYEEVKSHFDKFVKSIEGRDDIEINLTDEDKEVLIKAAGGLTLAEAENAFAKAVASNKRLSRDDVNIILEEKKQIVLKSGTLEYFETDVKFNSVGGLDELKDWMRKRNHAFTEAAKDFGIPTPKGALLLGVQGTGKSMVCKTLGSLWEMPVLRFDIGSIFGRYVGESENNMRKALAVAEAVAPCLVWVDELEKGFSGMTESSDSGTSSRVLSYFLSWMQDNTKPIFIVATCNDVSKLPPELLRKGRLDEIFFIDLPCQEEREEIFRIHLDLRHRDPVNFDIPALAKASLAFSGAEIEQAVVSGLFDAYDESRELTTDDILLNISKTVPISRTMSHKIEYLRDWAAERARPASSVTIKPELDALKAQMIASQAQEEANASLKL